MVDDHEELLSNSVARLERVRYKHERLSKILISVKAGVEHLQDKLQSTATEVSQSAAFSRGRVVLMSPNCAQHGTRLLVLSGVVAFHAISIPG